MTDMRNIVILTGAGISAESGIDTFRDAGGLWEQHRVEDVATPEGFARDPELSCVSTTCGARRSRPSSPMPRMRRWRGGCELGRRAADRYAECRRSARTRWGGACAAMHGTHLNAWCFACDVRTPWTGPLIDRPACPACDARSLRPDVVWFGEMPYEMGRIYSRAAAGETCSCRSARRARSIPRRFRRGSAPAARPARSSSTSKPKPGVRAGSTNTRQGPATKVVPQWVDEVLGG